MAASILSARRAALLCAALLACGASPAQDKPGGLPARNSQLPIDLQAASSDFDYKNNSLLFKRVKITQGQLQVMAQEASASGLNFDNSEWTLTGEVQILVPDGKLESNSAQVTFRNNEIVRAVIKGTPATFEQKLKDKGQLARGKAQAIEYDVQAATVRLTGGAWLTDGPNEIRGNTLIYDIGKQRVVANPDEKDPGGVRITINPQNPPPAPPKDKAP
jgi:lipopolysaccharide transport protein LptA